MKYPCRLMVFAGIACLGLIGCVSRQQIQRELDSAGSIAGRLSTKRSLSLPDSCPLKTP